MQVGFVAITAAIMGLGVHVRTYVPRILDGRGLAYVQYVTRTTCLHDRHWPGYQEKTTRSDGIPNVSAEASNVHVEHIRLAVCHQLILSTGKPFNCSSRYSSVLTDKLE
ncbi:hypothetical protein B0H34DRAFT_713088 [Crassisporium funariophilum]|nr:hypothetical protein B0H34DRAFT_713088 [Crassisporium funariophilum]